MRTIIVLLLLLSACAAPSRGKLGLWVLHEAPVDVVQCNSQLQDPVPPIPRSLVELDAIRWVEGERVELRNKENGYNGWGLFSASGFEITRQQTSKDEGELADYIADQAIVAELLTSTEMSWSRTARLYCVENTPGACDMEDGEDLYCETAVERTAVWLADTWAEAEVIAQTWEEVE